MDTSSHQPEVRDRRLETGNRKPAFGLAQRLAYATRMVLNSLLLAGIAVVLNLLAFDTFVRFDLTEARKFQLNDATVKVLEGLHTDVQIDVVPRPPLPEEVDSARPRFLERLGNLLGEYAARSPRVRFGFIGETDRDGYIRLKEHFEEPEYDAVYLTAKTRGGETRKQQLHFQDLFTAGLTAGDVINFRAEHAITNAIRHVAQEEVRTVYVTVGHMEFDPFGVEDRFAMGHLFLQFRNRDGVELKPLSLLDEGGVPEDCSLLIIAGAQSIFDDVEIRRVKEYLDRGGALFYTAAQDRRSGLEGLLRELGVEIHPYVLLEPRVGGIAPEVLVGGFGPHEINRGMAGGFLRVQAAVAVESAIPAPETREVVVLATTGPNAWEERQPLGTQERPRKDDAERSGPLGVGIVSGPRSDPAEPQKVVSGARVVVWGSVLTLTNLSVVRRDELGVDTTLVSYLLNMFRWLMGRPEEISIPEVRDELKPYDPQESERAMVTWVVRGFPAAAFLVGLIVWWRRRA